MVNLNQTVKGGLAKMRKLKPEGLQQLRRLGGWDETVMITQFSDPQLEKTYEVFLVEDRNLQLILKRGTVEEIRVYQKLNYLEQIDSANHSLAVPRLLKNLVDESGVHWLVLSYFRGEDLRSASDETFTLVGVELAKLVNAGYLRNANLPQDKNIQMHQRLLNKIVPNSVLMQGLQIYLSNYYSSPKVFTNDDLLPINILWQPGAVSFIDWEYGRTGTYVADLGRLLAFTEFGMRSAIYSVSKNDGQQVVDSFYEGLSDAIRSQRSYCAFRRDLAFEIFYQHLLALCHLPQIEKVYLDTAESQRIFQQAEAKAKKIIICSQL